MLLFCSLAYEPEKVPEVNGFLYSTRDPRPYQAYFRRLVVLSP